MTNLLRFPGVKLLIGDREFVVPAISLGRLSVLHERLQKFAGIGDKESIDLAIDATHAAVSRNYPDITREELGELIDVSNLEEIMLAVMDVSGMRRKAANELGKQSAESPSPGNASSAS